MMTVQEILDELTKTILYCSEKNKINFCIVKISTLLLVLGYNLSIEQLILLIEAKDKLSFKELKRKIIQQLVKYQYEYDLATYEEP